MIAFTRILVGKLVLFFDRLFAPKPTVHRAIQSQKEVDAQTAKLALYQIETCPFCVKTRRAAKRLALKIDLRDAQNIPEYKNELIAGGGKYQTPCLKITKDDNSIQWMYESSDIIEYLNSRFADIPGVVGQSH